MPGAAAIILLALILFFGLYMVWEISRWVLGNKGGITRSQFVRRIICGLLLLFDLGLWLAGDLLIAHWPPRLRLIYMLLAMLPLPICMMLAVREAGVVIRQYVRQRRELYKAIVGGEEGGGRGAPPG